MKAKTLLLLLSVVLVACHKEEVDSNTSGDNSIKYKIICKEHSPYLDWYMSNGESFVSYVLRDYPVNEEGIKYERVQGNEDNNINLNEKVVVQIHDDYTLDNDGKVTTLSLKREANINQSQNVEYESKFEIPSATPIELVRPKVDKSNPIPMCYFDNFEIEWNGDETNRNGVVIIAEWNGCTMHKPAEPLSYACVDIVDDKGVTTLKTELFEKMPNEALVNLWLIRGNLISIGHENTNGINEITKYSQDEIAELLSKNPELLLQMQPFMLGAGAVATFSFFLIKEK